MYLRTGAEIVIQQIDAGDLETLDTLLPPDAGERRTLADMIFAKLNEAELESDSVNKIVKGGLCIYPAISAYHRSH